jgi:hypothetical protein
MDVRAIFQSLAAQPYVDLREAFIARAAQQNAAIEIVESSDYLDRHEALGALLRYRDNERTV